MSYPLVVLNLAMIVGLMAMAYVALRQGVKGAVGVVANYGAVVGLAGLAVYLLTRLG